MVNELSYAYHLLYPSLTILVSCIDEKGNPNLITIAWSTPLSFSPPLLGISIGYKRYSYKLISKTKEFVICVPTIELHEKVFGIGTVSGRDIDKFKHFGLTPVKAKIVKPPLVKECIANIECKVEKEIPAGDHAFFIGRVVAIHYDNKYYEPHKLTPILSTIKPLLHVGGSTFCTIDEKSKVEAVRY